MALRRSLLRIDTASLLELFGRLKIRNFGYTPSCLQLLRKSMSSFNLFFLYCSFSHFRKSSIVIFPYFRAISDHSMIEMCRLKNVVIFFRTILSFVLSRKIINIYNDIAWKYGNITVKDFQKYEKLQYKKNKLKLDIDFLNNCKQLGVYSKFFTFKLPNVSNKDAASIRKRLICSAINKCNQELQHVSKDLSLFENFLSKHLSTINFYILTKSRTSHNKKSLLKSLYIQQKKLSSLTRDCSLPIFKANKTITNLTQYELSQEESDLLKAGLYFSTQPDKNRKSKIFTTFEKIHRSFINNLNSKETNISTTTNLLHVYYVNIASYETLEKIKISL